MISIDSNFRTVIISIKNLNPEIIIHQPKAIKSQLEGIYNFKLLKKLDFQKSTSDSESTCDLNECIEKFSGWKWSNKKVLKQQHIKTNNRNFFPKFHDIDYWPSPILQIYKIKNLTILSPNIYNFDYVKKLEPDIKIQMNNVLRNMLSDRLSARQRMVVVTESIILARELLNTYDKQFGCVNCLRHSRAGILLRDFD